MNPMEKVKQNKKKLLSSLIVFILIASFFTGLFIITSEPVKSAAEDYAYYKTITIESDYISADLTNFPVLVHLDENEDMYDHVLNNLSDIAFFDSTKTVQFYHEVEYYNVGGGVIDAYIWVNVTSISSSEDTVIYLLYDDSDGGYPTSYYQEQVWDSNFVMVQHLNGSQDTNCLDSTSTNNDVTGDYGTPSYQQTGVAGYGVDLVSASTETLVVPDDNTLDITGDFTTECWVKPDSLEGNRVYSKCDSDGVDERTWLIEQRVDGQFRFECSKDGTSANTKNTAAGTYNTTSWHYVVGTFRTSDNYIFARVNQNVSAGTDLTGDMQSSSADVFIGSSNDGGPYDPYDGFIDECRISNCLRNDSWLNATFHTINETTGFITFGAATSNVDATTLTPTATTHQGEQGNTTYSNESGTAYTWLVWNLSDGTEYLRINITNMPSNLTSANFSYQFTSDNTSWSKAGTWKSGSAGGWSMTINNSTWATGNGCYGDNIFTIDDDSDGINETDGWTELWCVERCAIPTGIGNETYTDTEGTKPTWDSGRYS